MPLFHQLQVIPNTISYLMWSLSSLQLLERVAHEVAAVGSSRCLNGFSTYV